MDNTDKQLQEQLNRDGLVVATDDFIPNIEWLDGQLVRIASLKRVGFRRKVLALKKILDMCGFREKKEQS